MLTMLYTLGALMFGCYVAFVLFVTFVVIDEVDMEDWGVGGVPVEEFRKSQQHR